MSGLHVGASTSETTRQTTRDIMCVIFANNGSIRMKLPSTTLSQEVALQRRLLMQMRISNRRTDCVTIRKGRAG